MTATRTELTVADLDEVLNGTVPGVYHPHGGWGYATDRGRVSDRERGRIDRYVIRKANEKGWSIQDLFFWADSKHGRWLWDTILTSEHSSSMTLAQIDEALEKWGCFNLRRIT